MRANREVYLVCLRVIGSRRHLHIYLPASGRVGRIASTRELVISDTPYVAAYVATEASIRILRVLHGAQEWPDNLPTS